MDTLTSNRISDFIRILKKVKDSRFSKTTKSIGYNLNFTTGEPLQQETTGYDEEDLKSMLIDLRKFTIKTDGVFLLDICDLLIQHTTDETIIDNLSKCKNRYLQIKEQTPIIFMIDNEIETGWSTIRKWLYGEYIHDRQERQNLLNLGIGQEMHKFNFLNLILGLKKVCSVIARNAEIILDRQKVEA